MTLIEKATIISKVVTNSLGNIHDVKGVDLGVTLPEIVDAILESRK